MTKTRDTRTRAQILSNAYAEALVGLFALRLKTVQLSVTTHAPVMTVMSSYEGEHLNLDAQRIVNDISLSGDEVASAVNQITSAFVMAMWDLLKLHAHYDSISTEPEIQFFRHLRNACSHDWTWNYKDLRYKASWRDKELTMDENGMAVFNRLLKHGDVFLLFKDIDLKYFEQR